MQDLFPIPSCFSSGEKLHDDPTSAVATRSGQGAALLIYRTRIAGHCRLITVTWCKNLLAHGLSVLVEGSDKDDEHKGNGSSVDVDNNNSSSSKHQNSCKVEMRPWNFWRKHGSKRFLVEGKPVDVFWDLRSAKFSDEPEPQSDYYVAVVSDGEVVLLLGDLKEEAFRRTGSRPSLIEAILVSKKEHVFGKKRFSARAKFHEKGKFHDISIECNGSSSSTTGSMDSEMVMKVDRHVAIHVRHLQWKFRGNESISINKQRVQVYWDVHDWLFTPGLRHALFIFKPESLPSSSTSSSSYNSFAGTNANGGESSGFCLFLYAWKLE
ncbi:uncharacterized protein LOC103719825 [Phoenix dactylifera]|uniref:Uncharacterized protein LOC103719825 n=1 Tax=Phoenix dactylifera TaxID=42345 RepID=A0A8B7CW90_PHODC|nr:uncharacterized protein LOC103719825 [Phoenix dactylifera]